MVGAGRRRTARALGAVVGTALAFALLSPGAATARSDDLLVFDDDSFCEIVIHDLHSSHNPVGDVSVHVTVDCFLAGSRTPMRVDGMTVETSIGYSLAILDAEELGTCPPSSRQGRSSGEFPCHQAPRGAGYYHANSTVSVSLRGATEELSIADTRQFNPSAVA